MQWLLFSLALPGGRDSVNAATFRQLLLAPVLKFDSWQSAAGVCGAVSKFGASCCQADPGEC